MSLCAGSQDRLLGAQMKAGRKHSRTGQAGCRPGDTVGRGPVSRAPEGPWGGLRLPHRCLVLSLAEEPTFRCDECDELFPSKPDLRRHKKYACSSVGAALYEGLTEELKPEGLGGGSGQAHECKDCERMFPNKYRCRHLPSVSPNSISLPSASSPLSLLPSVSAPRSPPLGLPPSVSPPRPPPLGLPHLGLHPSASLPSVSPLGLPPRSPPLGLHPSVSPPQPPPLGLLPSVSPPRSPPLSLHPSVSPPRPPPLGLPPLGLHPSVSPPSASTPRPPSPQSPPPRSPPLGLPPSVSPASVSSPR
ncbi:hypothetical protein P7K49_015227, partial [Saguinus oedipus]